MAAAPLGAINGPPVGFRIQWSEDGTMLAVIADWTADNVTDVYILPTSGAPGGIRLVPPAIAAGDATDAVFSGDGSRLFILGDLVTDTESELFTTTDFATAGQAAGGLILEDVPVDGDLDDDGLVPQPALQVRGTVKRGVDVFGHEQVRFAVHGVLEAVAGLVGT